MIYKIYSNNPLFNEIKFNKGLNMIVGERSEKSDKQSTCNGVGKSTLLRIIAFCLGSKGSKLPNEHLEGWNFTIEMDLFGEIINVTRSIDNKNEILIEGNTDNFPLNPKSIENEIHTYKLNDWKIILAKGIFDFEENKNVKYNPTFRNLMHYFHRDGSAAYEDPFKKFRAEKSVQWQIANSFLLNLKWEDASESQEIKDEANLIKDLKKIYNKHFLKDIAGKTFLKSKGDLETELIKLEKRTNKINEDLSRFEINEKYKEVEKKANNISKDISNISDEKFILEEKLSQYENAVKNESDIDRFNLENIYNELNFHLGASIKKTLEDAQNFHETIIKNRKKFLEVEISHIRNLIDTLEKKNRDNNSNLKRMMSILDSTMAFEKYKLISDEHDEDKRKIMEIKSKLDEIESINRCSSGLKVRKTEFEKIIERDYEESKPEREKAIHEFDKCSIALYGESGSLIIDADENGYSFVIKISKGNSDGVSRMKIFCYDLTLLEISLQRNNIDFLIHDSNIFYGVDERQIANGLEYIKNKSLDEDFQYICAMNSDEIPYDEFSENFNIEDYVIHRLNDNKESGTALGFYYD